MLRNPIRKIGFYSMLVLVFLQYSRLHETLSFVTSGNTYILYVFTIPALIALVGSGGLRRDFQMPPVLLWLAFTAWMCVATMFSVWKGGSVSTVLTWARVVLPMMFIFGELPMGWKEVRLALYAMATGGIAVVSTGRAFINDAGGGRLGLEFGLIGNPNDYAGHLLAVLPVVFFLVFVRPNLPIVGSLLRLAGIAALAYGLYLILRSGSRGALIALVGTVLYIFWKGSARVRMTAVIVLPLVALILGLTIPKSTLIRLVSFSLSYATEENEEAVESALSRQYLFNQSVKLTFTRPLFGVGPGQFGTYEGDEAKQQGRHGGWLETHNSFTQISSENGIPGILLYLSAILASFKLLRDAEKKAREHPEMRHIQIACFCLSVSYFGYLAAIAFLNFGYFFYLPAFAGLFIAVKRAALVESDALNAAASSANQTRGLKSTPPQPAAAVAASPAPKSAAVRERNPYRFSRMR